MYMNNEHSVEVDVIYNKLIKFYDELITSDSLMDNLENMKRTQEIYSLKPITSKRKFFAPLVIYFKRIVRRLMRWYVEPVYEKQMKFNNADIKAIDKLIKNQEDLTSRIEQLEEMNKKISEMNLFYVEKLNMFDEALNENNKLT